MDETGSLVDPHEELLRRLRELETFRAAAGDLGTRPILGCDVFAAPAKGNKIDPSLIPLADHQADLLVRAFHSVLTKLGEKARVFSITVDSVSVIERMRMVVDTIRIAGGAATFSRLLGDVRERSKAIGVFCALLELCKRRMIVVTQEGPCAEISIRLADVEATLPENIDVAD